MKIVSGIHEDESSLTAAVKKLQEQGVPADEISVIVRDPSGEEKEAPVDLESGVVQGAVIGGSLGAALGAAGLTLVSTGVIVVPGVSLLAAGPVLSAIRGAVAGGALGGGVGGLAGIGRFFSKPHIDAEALEKGSAIVSVHSDDLAEIARTVLEETGAGQIRVEEDHEQGA